MRVRSVGALLLGTLALMAALVGWFCPPAGAHTGDQSYVYLDTTEDALGGRVELPYADVRSVLGLSLEGSPEEVEAEIAANGDRLRRYASDHIRIGTDGRNWPLVFQGASPLESEEAWAEYVVLPFVADLGGAAPPRTLEVRFDPFFDEIEGRDALLLVGNDWNGGVIENAEEVLVAFDPDSRTQTVDLGSGSWWKNFTASTELGLDHIRTGPDHIFFVFVLLLPSVLLFLPRPEGGPGAGSWAPGRSFGQGLWRILKIATMFTLAHSITFTLAGLDLLPLPPSKFVESVIAASIAVAALHNLRPLAPNREWLIAFAFGLFHGLGFASLVSTLEVSRSTQLISLLGRNVGIEIGQAIVVLMAFPALYLLSRTRLYRPLFVLSSVGLAAVAVGWLIERLFEVDLGISGVVDKIVAWPRSLVLAVLAAVVAALLYWWEATKGRLLPVAGERTEAPPSPALVGAGAGAAATAAGEGR